MHLTTIDVESTLCRVKGNEFRNLRKSAGFSQSQLSKELDVTIRSITRWETDVNPIPRIAELAIRYLVDKVRARKKS